MARVRLEGLSKRFAETLAVDDVTLDIEDGELFGLLGASGSGKTTLLRLLGGFEAPSAGRVLIDGVDVTAAPPYQRPTNMVFQSYALFPHMTVAKNIAFGLKQARIGAQEIASRVDEALELVRLTGFGGRKPSQLSGGQRQRVALARALVLRPKLLLLDEPLSALDKKLREQTQFELMRLQRQLGITFVMVTHDQDEAMAMATRIAVMDHGRVVEVGAPRAIYERPGSRFVADFIGGANILDAEPARAGLVRLPSLGVTCPGELAGKGWIALRPERIALSRAATSSGVALQGAVEAVAFHGDVQLYGVRLDGGAELRVSAHNAAGDPGPRLGDRVWLSWPDDAPVVLTR